MSNYVEIREENGSLRFRLQEEAFDDNGYLREDELQEMHGHVNVYGGNKVILDLRAAPRITHEIITELLPIHWKLQAAGKQLVIRCTEGPQLEKFQTTHTDRIFQIEALPITRLERTA